VCKLGASASGKYRCFPELYQLSALFRDNILALLVLGELSSLSAVSYLQPSDHARFPAYARYAPLIL
jgi:hypothetical protein